MTVDLQPAFDHPFDGVEEAAVAGIGPLTRGKVRDLVDLGDRLALIATDRVSAFDRVLGTVPYRGQVLNELAAWWFERIADLVPSHVVSVPDANVTIGKKCTTLPVEVVVRGQLSGSTSTALWTAYAAGERTIYGIDFPDGMRKNDPLPEAIITPTTKAEQGGHDEPITEADIVATGLVEGDREIEEELLQGRIDRPHLRHVVFVLERFDQELEVVPAVDGQEQLAQRLAAQRR